MKIHEIIRENDVPGSIANDLMDIVVTYLNKNQTKIPMTGQFGIITYLKNLGYTIDINGVMNLLDTPEFDEIVKRSTPDMIELYSSTSDERISKDEMDQNKEKVERAAEKEATRATKAGEQI